MRDELKRKTKKTLTSTLASVLFVMATIFLSVTSAYAQDSPEEVKASPPSNIGDLAPLMEKKEDGTVVNEYGPGFVEMVQESGVYAPAFDFFTTSMLWTCIAAALVFIMHLGFACLESGLCQSKNTVNILFKNVSIIAIGLLTYALCGFNLMYPGEFNGFLGFAGFGLTNPSGNMIDYASGSYTYYTDFIFQAMFAATAATIVSGAVAERVKLSSFLIFSTIYVAFVYPVLGSWKWGGGWLDQLGFYDFAGSTIVHSVGGWAALIGAYLIGPRIGKYTNSGIKPIMGHNMPLVCIGVFLLWFGWYGFNGGSVLSADPILVSYVFVTTTLSAAGGIIGSMLISWTITKKPDLSMVLKGSLAGLVGITAGADVISPF